MTDSGKLSYFYSYFSVNIFDIMYSFPLFFVRFALAGRIVGGFAPVLCGLPHAQALVLRHQW